MENAALIADLLEWVSPDARPYAEVMEAWRTSCPRLTIWEDAVDAELVRLVPGTQETLVEVTEQGMEFLRSVGRRT